MRRLRIASSVIALVSFGSSVATGQAPSRPPALPLLRTVPPLTQAVLNRDLPRLHQLLDAGEDPNQSDDQGFSPWMWAVNFEENDALKLLLDKIPAIAAADAAGRRKLAMTAS